MSYYEDWIEPHIGDMPYAGRAYSKPKPRNHANKFSTKPKPKEKKNETRNEK